jgi:hypothetical protein
MGPTGSTGVMGLQGATGAMGLQGATGVMGLQVSQRCTKTHGTYGERTVSVRCQATVI